MPEPEVKFDQVVRQAALKAGHSVQRSSAPPEHSAHSYNEQDKTEEERRKTQGSMEALTE